MSMMLVTSLLAGGAWGSCKFFFILMAKEIGVELLPAEEFMARVTQHIPDYHHPTHGYLSLWRAWLKFWSRT